MDMAEKLGSTGDGPTFYVFSALDRRKDSERDCLVHLFTDRSSGRFEKIYYIDIGGVEWAYERKTSRRGGAGLNTTAAGQFFLIFFGFETKIYRDPVFLYGQWLALQRRSRPRRLRRLRPVV